MREIKFKYWYKEGKTMLPGESLGFIVRVASRTARETGIVPTAESFEDNYIPLQYTGLKDKNGKEIYEGDILETEDRVVKVSWHELAGCWDTDFVRYKGKRNSNGLNNSDWRFRAEVIGNLYSNPELL